MSASTASTSNSPRREPPRATAAPLRPRAPRRFALGVAVAACASVALAAAAACSDDAAFSECHEIPQAGCPRSADNVCDDPTCASAYVCRASKWELAYTCPAREASADAARPAPSDASSAPRDAGIDVDFPGAAGGPGCPALETPDCTLAAAAVCPSGCCGCENLFVCVNEGWSSWGYCDEDAGIVARP